jgi:hypothetical protein
MIHNLKPFLLFDAEKFREKENIVTRKYRELAAKEGDVRKYKESDPIFEDAIFIKAKTKSTTRIKKAL